MTSIVTNGGAISALQTLRSVGSNLQKSQAEISSGFRVETAADNTAYWSIATTMRSDNVALSAVSDALGLGAAKLDIAYAGMTATVDILTDFKTKIVAASEPGVDRTKIQNELEELKQQVVSIATSSSFSGENWLNTDIADMGNEALNKTSLVTSFVRNGSGSVSINSTDIDLSKIALFNKNGLGLLQAESAASTPPTGSTTRHSVTEYLNFSGPITLTPSDSITFDTVIIRGGSMSDVTVPTIITFADVNEALGITTGTISNAFEMSKVLPAVWDDNAPLGSGATGQQQADGSTLWEAFLIQASNVSGETDSHVEIRNLVSTLAGGAAGGLETAAYHTTRDSASGRAASSLLADATTAAAGEELPISLVDIDITDGVGTSLDAVEQMLARTTDAAAMLGSLKMRIDMQSIFSADIMDTIEAGVGNLVDADMDEASTRLKALQTQQQLGIQALSIANAEADKLMQLFE